MTTCVTCGQTLPVDKLEEAGKRAAAEAERMWKLDIFDPPIGSTHPRASECLGVIAGIIRRNGWDWALPYRGDGHGPEWCGMAAGDWWREAGLDPSWLGTYFPSTYRLALWATYQRFSVKSKPNPKPAANAPARLYVDLTKPLPSGVEPRAGDIIIVGDGDPRVGDHVTICMKYDQAAQTFDTISGNGGGIGPRGDTREGVSRRAYTIGSAGYRPLWLIRPALGDLL